jgi:hypothetical protein
MTLHTYYCLASSNSSFAVCGASPPNVNSPDIMLCDFYLFLQMKDWLRLSLQECSKGSSGFENSIAGGHAEYFSLYKCLKKLAS